MGGGARRVLTGDSQCGRRAPWRARLRLLLLLAAAGAASQSAPCEDEALRPVLREIRPSRLPWRGGVITVTGAAFDHRIVVSVGASGGAPGGLGPQRHCTVLGVSSSVLTCLAPPSEHASAEVSARVLACESAQLLPLEYVGWRWQDAWRWQALGAGVDGGGPAPSPRMGHTLSADGDGNLVLYGGLADAGVLGDVWVLKKLPEQAQGGDEDEAWVWSAQRPSAYAPPRTEHVAGVLGGCLYVFGGWNAQTAPARDAGAVVDGADDSEVVDDSEVLTANYVSEVQRVSFDFADAPGAVPAMQYFELGLFGRTTERMSKPVVEEPFQNNTVYDKGLEEVQEALSKLMPDALSVVVVVTAQGWRVEFPAELGDVELLSASTCASLTGACNGSGITVMEMVSGAATGSVPAKFEAGTYALNLRQGVSGSAPLAWARVEAGSVQPQPRRGACSAISEALGLVMYGGHDSESREVVVC